MKCSVCNFQAHALDQHCRKCGLDLEKSYCSECNSIVKKEDVFCWKCGTSLEKDED